MQSEISAGLEVQSNIVGIQGELLGDLDLCCVADRIPAVCCPELECSLVGVGLHHREGDF